MTPDPLQERVARVLASIEVRRCDVGDPDDPIIMDQNFEDAAVVLADLREAGEMRTLEQVGWMDEFGALHHRPPAHSEWDPVWVEVREESRLAPCPNERFHT